MSESPGVSGLYRLPSGSHIRLADVTLIHPYGSNKDGREGSAHVQVELKNSKDQFIGVSVPFNTYAEAIAFGDNIAMLANEARKVTEQPNPASQFDLIVSLTGRIADMQELMDGTVHSWTEKLERIILILSQIRDHE